MTFRWEPNCLPYLTRVLELPPLVAQSALHAARSARRRHLHHGRWDIETVAGRLELYGDGWIPPPPRPCYWAYRHVPGRIQSSGWQPAIAVGLELVPWSATRTALGLYVDGLPLIYADERLYVDVGRAALNTLAVDLETWALHDLTVLEQSFRNLGQSPV